MPDHSDLDKAAIYFPQITGVETEGDVEIKVILPILSSSNYLNIGLDKIKNKTYLSPSNLDKSAGKLRGYFPDFSIWSNALPLLVVEAKSPDVKVEEGYREAALYAHNLNQLYKSGLNPCHFILACNGTRLLAGAWDAEPSIDVDIADLVIGSSALQSLRDFCGSHLILDHARRCLLAMKVKKAVHPYNKAGGQALLNSKKAFNDFAAELAPVLRRYFTSTSQNDDKEIYEKGYVGSDDITTYDAVLEALLKDRIVGRRGDITQDLNPTRSSEPRLTGAIAEFKSATLNQGQLQLITGGVGSGKSLFARRYKELLQPEHLKKVTHWAFIDFNTAPDNLDGAEIWICEQFVESFQKENAGFDPYESENLNRIFARDLQKRRGVYAELSKISESEVIRQRATDFQIWQDDPRKLSFGICNYFVGSKSETVVVVMDNVDKLELKDQLSAFQLSLWFMSLTNAFIILQMRDETYERFKDRPPLDTYRTGVIFHVTPPRFLDVVKRRLELSLEYLSINVSDTLEYTLSNGYKIQYPKTMLGDFLHGIYIEIFSRKHVISRILQGIAGRDVRKALDMFQSILTSGHLATDAITSQAKGAGEIRIPEYTVLKILMRTEYRFYSDVSGYVKNIFHFDENWTNPNNFIIGDIIFWLTDNRKKRGDIGLEGYFSVKTIADSMQLRGYATEDVIAACSWLLKNELIEADHMNKSSVSEDDSVKVTASGFIHLRILCERIEYIYSVLTVTPILNEDVAAEIGVYINRENQNDKISVFYMAQCVEKFLKYLEFEHALRCSEFPEFGSERSGASFLIEQIQSALTHFRNPSKKAAQPNLLDWQ
ncbi:MAG: hypothetical protein LDL37_06820 [Asticcacaulis sp.]|uniref:type I restriction endonuclease n=1 Tax=Asticcacaulis sp. TaxID=1872648 RepID=UPI0025BFEE7E|nr:type I restriction endonuclease [Asticcacaulis sp.]MCA1935146.1 hypothetical protein [Asticcacaulis sp.]